MVHGTRNTEWWQKYTRFLITTSWLRVFSSSSFSIFFFFISASPSPLLFQLSPLFSFSIFNRKYVRKGNLKTISSAASEAKLGATLVKKRVKSFFSIDVSYFKVLFFSFFLLSLFKTKFRRQTTLQSWDVNILSQCECIFNFPQIQPTDHIMVSCKNILILLIHSRTFELSMVYLNFQLHRWEQSMFYEECWGKM